MEKTSRYGRLYGLVGKSLGHSFSRNFFNSKFESENIDARYVNFELPSIDHFPDLFTERLNLAGVNITIPYKQQVIPYLDALDPVAQEIGAVNVVKIYRQPDGSISLKGYNSDAIGFGDSLRPLVCDGVVRRALVLGTGGASRAVDYALRKLGITPTFVSRTPREGVITYADITPEVITDHLVIVNTTPLGMYPDVDACPDIPYRALTPAHICYDLLYNPDNTMFMKKAAARGATVKNGLEMLLLQAFVSWNIWNK